ncbi:YgjV family protein [Pseudoalteromonas spongiae]|uniref:YgjV family protein n=1 Tax=Pseudoalteromonas spongiae TaxID=298657 RepID=A0ABU8EX32_9GAMM
MFIVSQCLVAIATLLDLASFQFKSRNAILICLFTSVLLTAVHFFLLDKISAACLMFLAALRYGYCIFARDLRVMIGFMAMSISVVYVTWQSWISVIALVAALLQTYASFQTNDFTLRCLMIVGTLCWILHNVLVFSPVAVLLESVFLISNIIGLWRFYGKKAVIG